MALEKLMTTTGQLIVYSFAKLRKFKGLMVKLRAIGRMCRSHNLTCSQLQSSSGILIPSCLRTRSPLVHTVTRSPPPLTSSELPVDQDFTEVFILKSFPEYLDELPGLGTTDVINKFIVEPRFSLNLAPNDICVFLELKKS